MSVNQTNYVLYGAVLPPPENARDEDEYYEMFEEYRDSYYDDKIGNKNGVTVILGESFCAIGNVIDKVGRDDYAVHVAIPSEPPIGVPHIRDAIEMMGFDRDIELGWHFVPNYT